MTNSLRCRRGFTDADLCPICHQSAETPFQLLRDCGIAQEVWRGLSADLSPNFFLQDNFEVWLLQNLKSNNRGQDGKWDMIFAITLDRLWWARNEFGFKQTILSSLRTLARVKELVADIQLSNRMLNCMDRKGVSQQGVLEVSWVCPGAGFVKLNCDGAVKSFTEAAACGGVLRDHNGTFLWGFAVKLGNCTVPQAELWGIIHGLRIAKGRGFTNIQLESDSLTAVKLINGDCLTTHQCKPLVNEIKNLFHDAGRIQVQHVYCEANQVADLLANHGLSLDISSRIFEFVPDFLMNSLLGDACNKFFPRGY